MSTFVLTHIRLLPALVLEPLQLLVLDLTHPQVLLVHHIMQALRIPGVFHLLIILIHPKVILVLLQVAIDVSALICREEQRDFLVLLPLHHLLVLVLRLGGLLIGASQLLLNEFGSVLVVHLLLELVDVPILVVHLLPQPLQLILLREQLLLLLVNLIQEIPHLLVP